VKHKSRLFSVEPNWFDARQLFNNPLPRAEQSWLFEPGSLTQRLRHLCGDEFQVRLLKQGWQKPFLRERRQLQLPNHHYALAREVALCCGEIPLVYARTIIPGQTLRGAQRRLSNLGTRPLGEVLFSSPKLARNGFELAAVSPAIWNRNDIGLLPFPDEMVWGRRTVYAISSHDLLVSEVFMPALFELERVHCSA
jgi:chorismate--pyruvate lyase